MSGEESVPPAEKGRRGPAQQSSSESAEPGQSNYAVTPQLTSTEGSEPSELPLDSSLSDQPIARPAARNTWAVRSVHRETPDDIPADRRAEGRAYLQDRARKAGLDQLNDRSGDNMNNGSFDSRENLAEPVRIALWGAPASGKTTLMAALGICVGRQNSAVGKWSIFPENDASAALLTKFTHQLIVDQRFPEATEIGSIQELSVIFKGDIAGSKFAPRKRPWRRGSTNCSFRLNLVDFSGEAFGYHPQKQAILERAANAALDNLASAQGLIYLFDPLSERDQRDSATYVERTLVELSRRMAMAGRLSGMYLPQQISVCITKFDHPEIFQQARRMNLIDEASDGTLRVLDCNAQRFFDMYCSGRFWGGDERSYAGAQFVRDSLQCYFAPDRIRYFVSSSIGLRRWSSENVGVSAGVARVNPEDFANFGVDGSGDFVIRGPIDPINVLEPLISLQQRIAGNDRYKG